ncbi:MAG: alginate export family protein [Mangrovibacterium sp.]
MKSILSLLTVLLLSTAAFAQDNNESKFSISSEIRPRYELRDGYKTIISEEEDAGQFISNRVRLNLDYSKGPLSMALKLQDVGIWGDRSAFINESTHKIGFFEAWAAYQLSTKLSLKAGRQILSYDDERIMGQVNWAQSGLSHDALVLQFKNAAGDIRMHLGASYNQTEEVNVKASYPYTNRSMQYLWLNRSNEKLRASFLFLNNGTQALEADVKSNYSQTFGLFLNNTDNSNWDLGGSLYGQTGEDVSGKSISAFYVAAHAKKVLTENYKLGVGFEILSGTDMTESDGKNHSFDPIYGTNHKFNGYMDYFYVGNHKGNVGLQDYYAQFDYQKNKFSSSLALHSFLAAADLSSDMDKYLGTEIDLTLNYKVDKDFSISAGYSHMFATDSLQKLKTGTTSRSNANWAYISLAFTPQFFSFSK